MSIPWLRSSGWVPSSWHSPASLPWGPGWRRSSAPCESQPGRCPNPRNEVRLSKECGLKALVALFVDFLLAAQLAPAPVWAAGAQPEESTYVPPLADPVLEARAKALQKELRCLVCQGHALDESNAPLAADLRRLIRQQIQGGQSDNTIKDFLVARYGPF